MTKKTTDLFPLYVRVLLTVLIVGLSSIADAVTATQWSCPNAKDLQGIMTRGAHVRLTPQDFATFLFDRAKTESEQWLVNQGLKDLCSDAGAPYFPNSCGLYKQFKDSPSKLATNTLIAQLKVDAEQLPSCHIFLVVMKKDPAITVNNYAALTKSHDSMSGYVAMAALTQFLANKNTPPTLDKYAALVKPIGKAVDVLAPGTIDINNDTVVSAAAQAAMQAVDDIDSKSFADKDAGAVALAIIGAVEGNSNVAGSTGQTAQALYATYTDVRAKHYSQGFADIGPVLGCKSDGSDTPHWCTLAGAVAQVADAKDATDAEATLNQIFAGATTWDSKLAINLFSLDAMVGVQGGLERLSAPLGATGATYGAFAPVGLDLSFKTTSICGAAGLFISAVDLGAWVSYSKKRSNAQGDTSSGTSKVSGSSLLSPGAYAYCTFRNSPYRIGMGVSQTPGLRSINLAGGAEQTANSVRYLIFFSVDIPLFDIKRW